MGGALEMLVRTCQHFLFRRLLFAGADAWWGGPLMAAGLVALLSVLLGAPLARTRLGPRVRYGIPLFLATVGLLLLIPRLAGWAAAILAAGIAVQASGWLIGRAAPFERLVWRTLPVLLLVPALGGAWLHLAHPRRQHPSLQARDGAPNVLLLVLDTVRAIEFGLYGAHPTITPNLDDLGAQGVVFDQAFSSAPWTAPSHASLFTGRRIHELSIDWKVGLDGTFPTLAEVLRGAGYASVGIVANTEYASAETGLARGFGEYQDYRLTLTEALRWTGLSRALVGLWSSLRHPAPADLPGRIGAPDVNRRLFDWLDHRSKRPWFAFLNYFDAHSPYFAPDPYWSRFLPGEPRRPRAVTPGAWSVQRVLLGRRAYQAGISYLDGQIGALLDSLRLRGALKQTLVIVAGDHGEEFLEHGLMGHGNSIYSPAVHVPLIVVWPGHLPARHVLEPVSLSGVPATIAELLGLASPFPSPSLVGYWTGRPPPAVAVTSAVTFTGDIPASYVIRHGAIASALLGRYRYIWTRTDTLGQLYDHETDPMESRNLVAEPWALPIVRALRDSVRVILPDGKDRIR